MKKVSFLVVVAMIVGVGLRLSTAPVLAHHAFASEYDADKLVQLKGSITMMKWVNPHGWLYIDVTEKDGKPVDGGKAVPWALEFGSPIRLLQSGWRKTDLPAGAVVSVEGYLAKNGTNTANANKVVLADGKELFAGSSAGDKN